MYTAKMPVCAEGNQYMAGDKIKKLKEQDERFLLSHGCIFKNDMEGEEADSTKASPEPGRRAGSRKGKESVPAGKGD